MNQTLHGAPATQVGLKLTPAERNLALEGLKALAPWYLEMFEDTPARERLMCTRDDLVHLRISFMANAELTRSRTFRVEFMALVRKLEKLLGRHFFPWSPLPFYLLELMEPGAPQLKSNAFGKPSRIAEWAQRALEVAEDPEFKDVLLADFRLAQKERALLRQTPDVPASVQTKLGRKAAAFTPAEIIHLLVAVAAAAPRFDWNELPDAALLQSRLLRHLESGSGNEKDGHGLVEPELVLTDVLYQLKITLSGTEPPVWRRIQVEDCTLAELHVHIQMAMGWENDHSHEFQVKGRSYTAPYFGAGDDSTLHTTDTALFEILPRSVGKRPVSFTYTYDFGDRWEHEVLFEGRNRCSTA